MTSVSVHKVHPPLHQHNQLVYIELGLIKRPTRLINFSLSTIKFIHKLVASVQFSICFSVSLSLIIKHWSRLDDFSHILPARNEACLRCRAIVGTRKPHKWNFQRSRSISPPGGFSLSSFPTVAARTGSAWSRRVRCQPLSTIRRSSQLPRLRARPKRDHHRFFHRRRGECNQLNRSDF